MVIVYRHLDEGVVGSIDVVLVQGLAIQQGIVGLCLSGQPFGARDGLQEFQGLVGILGHHLLGFR